LKPRLLTERDIKEEKGKHHPYVAFRRRVEKMTTRKVERIRFCFSIKIFILLFKESKE
jgi:hypothetical protein